MFVCVFVVWFEIVKCYVLLLYISVVCRFDGVVLVVLVLVDVVCCSSDGEFWFFFRVVVLGMMWWCIWDEDVFYILCSMLFVMVLLLWGFMFEDVLVGFLLCKISDVVV